MVVDSQSMACEGDAKASLIPIGQFQGLLLGGVMDSKHDDLEPISFNMIHIRLTCSNLFHQQGQAE